MTPPEVLRERIQSRSAQADGGCWEWLGSRKPNGYGEMTVDQKRRYTHRVAYEAFVGPIPDSLHLDHLCRNVACCNPEHLEPVTRSVNVLRGSGPGAQRRRFAEITECPQGHPYDDENTYVTKAGTRQCRECTRQRNRARRQTMKGAAA